jgi:hypothetical protein
MDTIVYEEMSPEESDLDWSVTRRVLSDAVLMSTLEAAQAGGDKHAVVALVTSGEVTEIYVSPESAVRKTYAFDAVRQAFEVYERDGGVCLLIVRDGKAVISINGMR